MGDLLINSIGIQQETISIEKDIAQLKEDNETAYKTLRNCLNKSQGDYVDKMKLLVEEEYKMINALADLYANISSYVKEVADEATAIDQKYSKNYIGTGVGAWPN